MARENGRRETGLDHRAGAQLAVLAEVQLAVVEAVAGAEEKALLENMLKAGTERVRKVNHARILLRANDGWADEDIQDALDVSIPTIQRVRYRFVEQSFEAALNPSPTRRRWKGI